MFSIIVFLGLSFFVSALPASTTNRPSSGIDIKLDYATYHGQETDGIRKFLGMRYAAPVTGERRFRAPQPPLRESSTQNATTHGPICYGVNGALGDSSSLPLPYSEDCLYIDVYAPENARNLPVMLWIQGGGFVSLFNPNYDGTGLIKAADNDVIIVTFNYRVGSYGFLASQELAKEGNLNIGLQDQKAAIDWVHKYISSFGGDPNRITLFGTSVGGGSVLLQLFVSQTWTSGIAASVYLPSVYTVDEMEFHYQDLLASTNCSDLACLRSLPSAKIQAANTASAFPGQKQAPLFGYAPVIDGSILPGRPLELLQQGKFEKRPLIVGSSETEGTIFVPQANNTADVNSFLKTQLPKLNQSDLNRIEALYSNVPRTYPGVTANESSLFYRTAEIYGDISFLCPAVDFVGPSDYFFLDRIHDPAEVEAGFIVPHTWELQAVWGPKYSTSYVALPNATSYNNINANIVPVVQKYWTNFARFGSPGSNWETFGNGSFLSLATNATRMEPLSSSIRQRCEFWQSLKDKTEQ